MLLQGNLQGTLPCKSFVIDSKFCFTFQHAFKSYIRMFGFELENLKENLKQQEIAKRVETRKNGKVRKLDKLPGG